ncbi:Mediator of RNA polymerase II transcription subunit 10 [Toxocara canis]|uniref:Mediator of RNA polymerase II transcription subunit 10 n=1 Tax=Toxocara canis TaxID=6265 RepID=A0A0B2VXQ7_TOXCA|nr:Mediator of RNA polymerase II transcription subunit 10 [Toxocara canis]
MDPSSGNIGAAPVLQDNATETRFNQLEQTLENFQENARQMGVIASDFNTRSQEPLNQKIHTLISGLRELDHLKNQFMDVKIPLELLEYLDQGKNPQLYTKECLERTLNKNKEVKRFILRLRDILFFWNEFSFYGGKANVTLSTSEAIR